MQKYIFPALAIVLSAAFPLATFAQSATSAAAKDEQAKPPLMVTLRQIELKLFGQESQQALPDRVNALEQTALGTTYQGPLSDRLDRVQMTLQGQQPQKFDEQKIIDNLVPAPLKPPDGSGQAPLLRGSVTDASDLQASHNLEAQTAESEAQAKIDAPKKQARAERNARLRREIGAAIGVTLKAAAVVAAAALVTVANSSGATQMTVVSSPNSYFPHVDTCACRTYTPSYASTMIIASHHHHHHH